MAETFLLFRIEGITFAIPAADVREVVRAVAITPLPGSPPIVEGVINVRGVIVPVMNARARFHLPERPLSLSDQLIVCLTGERVIALRADSSIGLQALEADKIASADDVTVGLTHLAGVARTADGLILVHDLATFLSEAEGEAIEGALAAAGARE